MPYRVGLVFCFASVVWLLQTAVHANVQTGNDVRFVYSDVTLQRAARDGVRHIVITHHLSAVGAQAVIESDNLSLSSGFIRLQDTSKSIVVRHHPDAVSRACSLPDPRVLCCYPGDRSLSTYPHPLCTR